MDDQLEKKLKNWHSQIEKIRSAEESYLNLEASEKSMFAELYLSSQGKTVIDRESYVYASKTWMDFKNGLVISKSKYNHERRLLDLYIKAFESEYASYKIDAAAIAKKGW